MVVGSQAAMRTAVEGTQGDIRLSSLHARLAAAADRLNLPTCAPFPFLACEEFRLGSRRAELISMLLGDLAVLFMDRTIEDPDKTPLLLTAFSY